MSTPQEIAAIKAEVTYYTDSVALLQARLYRRGDGDSPRLAEMRRRLDSAQRRLAAVDAAPPSPPQPSLTARSTGADDDVAQ